MQRGAPVAILRLAKVVSPGMALIDGWVEALRAGKPVRAFHDMTLAPTPTEMVCAAIGALLDDRADRHLSAHRAARRGLCRGRAASSPPISVPIPRW